MAKRVEERKFEMIREGLTRWVVCDSEDSGACGWWTTLAPKTSDSYRGIVRLHLIPAFGEIRLGSLTRPDVEHYLAKHTHLSARTVAYCLRILKAILADAVDHGKSRRRVVLSADVVQALLGHPAGDDPKKDYVFLGRTGEPIDPDVVDRAFKRHLTLAKQPEIRFHDLRHTFASFEIAAGWRKRQPAARRSSKAPGRHQRTQDRNTNG